MSRALVRGPKYRRRLEFIFALQGCVALTSPQRLLQFAPAAHGAGIAQLVERNLAKVQVASSSLVSRSRFSTPFMTLGPVMAHQ
jgi:hypothetical protein